jgi:hypothetical protein
MSIGSALCHVGLDEIAVAEQWAEVITKLSAGDAKDRGGAKKLLFDVLKECSRYLDNAHENLRAANAPVFVQLIHKVSRPARVPTALPDAHPAETIEVAAPAAVDSPPAAAPITSSTEAE